MRIMKNNLHDGNRQLQKQQKRNMRRAEKRMRMDKKHSKTIERDGLQTLDGRTKGMLITIPTIPTIQQGLSQDFSTIEVVAKATDVIFPQATRASHARQKTEVIEAAPASRPIQNFQADSGNTLSLQTIVE